MDYYLKAENEEALWSTLVAVGAATTYSIKDESGNIIEVKYVPTAGYDIDIIGTIYKPTGNIIQQTIDGSTYEVPEMAALEGFHANLRGPVDLAPRIEYVPYTPTEEEITDPSFVVPEPSTTTIPSPIEGILVQPKNPVRVWL